MSRRAALDLGALAALGAGVVALAAWSATWPLARAETGAFTTVVVGQLALCGIATAWVVRRRPGGRAVLAVVFLAALAARLVLVPHAPDVSGDINRYVWDGRVQAAGINPYRHAPSDPAVARFRDEAVFPGINRKAVPTIYPPAAQATFIGLHLAGARTVTALKLAFVLLEMAGVALLALLLARLGSAPARVVLYAWHPLAILEVGRSGHVDALVVLLLVGALLVHAARRPLLAGAGLAAAALVKLYAAVVLPALVWSDGRRRPGVLVAFAVAVVLGYLPYLGVGAGVLGYLPGYLDEEGFDSGRRFYLLARLDDLVGLGRLGPLDAAQLYQGLVVAVLGAAALWCWRRPPATPRATVDRALGMLLIAVVLTTPTYPWYLLMVLVLAPAASPRLAAPAVLIASSAPFLYLQWWLPGSPSWPQHLTWGAGAVALLAVGARNLRERSAPHHRPVMSPAASAEPTAPSTVLVVDDEPIVREVVAGYLRREGYRALEAPDGLAARELIERDPPSLIVLDLMLPGLDGLELCRWIRSRSEIPVIMLTARGEEADRIVGLDLGADDYVTKPFSPRELVARVRSVLRRSPETLTARRLEVADLTIDHGTREVTRGGQPIRLTVKEFDLLWFLASNPRLVFSRDHLMDRVWGYEPADDTGTVTVHVRRLREKIEPDPSRPRHIETVWGIGYRFVA